ncbi:PLDc N-terminal domain-containing protein [Haloarchaeobius sp. DT45]|uniref:PLDc N-terminal domain-containing protein n=1 Tax=Haloarchaeobius sp. DT45 TaxID=3446116 RepID=UPI003F6ABC82
MPATGILGLFVLLSFVVFVVVLPLWTYADAQQNSSQSAFLWALVVFFGALLGLLLYFLVGRDRTGDGRAHATY